MHTFNTQNTLNTKHTLYTLHGRYDLSVSYWTALFNKNKNQLLLILFTLFTEGASDFLSLALRNVQTFIRNWIHVIMINSINQTKPTCYWNWVHQKSKCFFHSHVDQSLHPIIFIRILLHLHLLLHVEVHVDFVVCRRCSPITILMDSGTKKHGISTL